MSLSLFQKFMKNSKFLFHGLDKATLFANICIKSLRRNYRMAITKIEKSAVLTSNCQIEPTHKKE